MPDHEKV